MRITGHIFGVRLLAGSLECLPGNVGGDGSGVRVQHFLNSVVSLAAMAVDAVFLVGQDVLLVLHKEVRHLLAGGHDHRAGRVVTVVLDHAAVTGGIGDVKVVVAAAGGKHIVLLQQFHGLGGGGGAVQHQADGHSGSQHRLAGILFGGFAVQRQHGNGNALLVDAVQAGKGCQQAGNFGLGAGISLVGTQVIQRGKGDGLVAVLGRGTHQHGRGIPLEVVVAAHQVVAAGLLDVEGAAAEGRRFDGDGQQRQRLLDGCINKALVIRRGVGDHLVQVVVIADLHAIEVVIIVVGQFFDRICGLDAAGVQRAEAHSGHGHNSQHPHSNAGGKFHSGSLLLVDWRIQVEHVGATAWRPKGWPPASIAGPLVRFNAPLGH